MSFSQKRILALFIVFITGFTLLQARLFVLMTESETAQAAAPQSLFRATIAVHRPDFYDRSGVRITGAQSDEYAVLYPGDDVGYELLAYVDEAGVEALLEGMGGATPFVLPLKADPADGRFDLVTVERRYAAQQSAAHLIGYLDYDGQGVSGLEAAFEDYFSAHLTRTVLETEVNAQGAAIAGAAVRVYEDDTMTSGAIVVLDTETGEIRAMVSRPDFDPADVAASLQGASSPLVNKALTAYNVGSIYKPVLAACALGAGLDGSYTHLCTGSIEVDGQLYSCNDGAAHGTVDMEQALVHSCNTYFIALGQRLGAQAVYNAACAVGANRRITLWDGFSSALANMPTLAQLGTGGELCNHSFGQGRLMLTPLHVAAATNALARGGLYTEPSLILSVGGEAAQSGRTTRIFEQEAAQTVARYLQSVVDGGTGQNANPTETTAAGKTGTAQTGSYNADGTERVVGWFTGWFPADEPRYTVVVMTDDEGYGFESAAPVFARVADEITARGY